MGRFRTITAPLIQRLGRKASTGIRNVLLMALDQYPSENNVPAAITGWREYEDMVQVCGAVAARYAQRSGLSRTPAKRTQLAFLLARGACKAWSHYHHEAADYPANVLRRYVEEELTFAEFRVRLEPAADALLEMLLRTRDDCPDCALAARVCDTCAACHEAKCPLHCSCACGKDTGGVIGWLRRIAQFLRLLPDVESVESDGDALLIHTRSAESPHLQLDLKMWWPEEGEEEEHE